MDKPQTRKVEPETLRRFAAEVAGIRLNEKELTEVADLLGKLLDEVAKLDQMDLADVEPIHRLRLERWSV